MHKNVDFAYISCILFVLENLLRAKEYTELRSYILRNIVPHFRRSVHFDCNDGKDDVGSMWIASSDTRAVCLLFHIYGFYQKQNLQITLLQRSRGPFRCHPSPHACWIPSRIQGVQSFVLLEALKKSFTVG